MVGEESGIVCLICIKHRVQQRLAVLPDGVNTVSYVLAGYSSNVFFPLLLRCNGIDSKLDATVNL